MKWLLAINKTAAQQPISINESSHQVSRQSEFLRLVDSHKGILIKVSRMYFADPNDQEELQQEIVLRLWESFESYRGESQFSSWMYRVGINTAITFFKKSAKRREVSLDVVQQIPHGANVEAEEESKLKAFYRAVTALDRIERALVLLYIEGFSHRAIGKQLGISEANARVKLNRTKSKLKTILREQNDGN